MKKEKKAPVPGEDLTFAPEGLRQVADYLEHMHKEHEGKVSDCPEAFQVLNLENVVRDLRLWANKLDSDSTLGEKGLRLLSRLYSRLDLYAIIAAMPLLYIRGAVGIALLAFAAWHRSWLTSVSLHGRSLMASTMPPPEMNVLKMSDLLGSLGLDLDKKPGNDDKRPDVGHYL